MKLPTWVWQIDSYVDDPKDPKRSLRMVTCVAASTIDDVWKYLERDKGGAGIDVVAINRFGPIVEVIEPKPEPEEV